MSRYCHECGKELLLNQAFFCNIDCEVRYRGKTDELFIKYAGGYDPQIKSFCPIDLFYETDTALIFTVKGSSDQFVYLKSDLISWDMSVCRCEQEFMDIPDFPDSMLPVSRF